MAQLVVEEVAEAVAEDLELADDLAAGAVVVVGAAEAGTDVDVGAAADVDVVAGAVDVVDLGAFLAAGELEPQAAARRVTARRAEAACQARRHR